jgi:hypothetical protein
MNILPAPVSQAPQLLRTRCRDPRCGCTLPAPVVEPRQAFCSRGCFEHFHRNRCRVCGQPSPNGRLHAKKCRYLHKLHSGLYAFKNPVMGRSSLSAPGPSRNPINPGIKTRAKSWGPTLTDTEFRAATLPLADRADRANDPERLRLVTAWSKPKPIFGRNVPPLNVVGGYKFPDAPALDLDDGGTS